MNAISVIGANTLTTHTFSHFTHTHTHIHIHIHIHSNGSAAMEFWCGVSTMTAMGWVSCIRRPPRTPLHSLPDCLPPRLLDSITPASASALRAMAAALLCNHLVGKGRKEV